MDNPDRKHKKRRPRETKEEPMESQHEKQNGGFSCWAKSNIKIIILIVVVLLILVCVIITSLTVLFCVTSSSKKKRKKKRKSKEVIVEDEEEDEDELDDIIADINAATEDINEMINEKMSKQELDDIEDEFSHAQMSIESNEYSYYEEPSEHKKEVKIEELSSYDESLNNDLSEKINVEEIDDVFSDRSDEEYGRI